METRAVAGRAPVCILRRHDDLAGFGDVGRGWLHRVKYRLDLGGVPGLPVEAALFFST